MYLFTGTGFYRHVPVIIKTNTMLDTSCLDNLIGISNTCNGTPSGSGLYLNDLPFISIANAGSVIDSEYNSAIGFLEQKLNFAQKKTITELRTYLLPYMRHASVIENDVIGIYKEERKATASEPAKYKGVNIKIDRYPYLSFNIGELMFFGDTTVNTKVYIINHTTGKQIKEVDIALVANEISYADINLEIPVKKQRLNIGIYVDSSVTGFYSADLKRGTGCNQCDRTGRYTNQYMTVQGAEVTGTDNIPLPGVTMTGNETHGLSIGYSLGCSSTEFICSISNLMAMPILYKAGEVIMVEMQVSNRFNSVIKLGSVDIEFLLQLYSGEYQKMYKDVTQNLRVPQDICFSCNNRVKYQTNIP